MAFSHLVTDRTSDFRQEAEVHGVDMNDIDLGGTGLDESNGSKDKTKEKDKKDKKKGKKDKDDGKSNEGKAFLDIFFADMKRVQKYIEEVEESTKDVDDCTNQLLEATTSRKEEAAQEELAKVIMKGEVRNRKEEIEKQRKRSWRKLL
jgi:hypothetical protein